MDLEICPNKSITWPGITNQRPGVPQNILEISDQSISEVDFDN